ncbi:MAG: thioredoxin domain-containing protein, partial [Crenarchaeota archaeon]|nr:thioredoxin domain-containing protein [Thermoproteota archaeon]
MSNRLANEKSPYLLQHANNPVNWYPWCEEAFEKARKESKPIFLSIGYSTCHWCHVMEKESFEDLKVAQLLNEKFVAIKVDREERPDIDSIYMRVCISMTGQGGWPLTIIMTPDKLPFFAGTYFPKNSLVGRMIGLLDILKEISNLWKKDKTELESKARKVVEYLAEYFELKSGKEDFTETILDEAFIELLDRFDENNGGFGLRPKFPSPHNFLFLLRYWKRKTSPKALEMVEKTLQKMRMGGIFDQIGFGFHRYSTDSVWMVPHFEKMLYDQAMMSIAYIEAYHATGKIEYKKTAEEIFDYVIKHMENSEGGFFSSEDADSEGQEGNYYLWTEAEIKKALPDNAELITKIFNISKWGNYAESQRLKNEKNILYLKKPVQELALELGLESEKLLAILEDARQNLYVTREKRIHPFKDNKILTDWNGLMIAALAKAAKAFCSAKYFEAAKKTVNLILNKVQTKKGRLLHRYKDGEAAIGGYLDDYAFLIWGLIELY